MLHDGDLNLNEFLPHMPAVKFHGVGCVSGDGGATYLGGLEGEAQTLCRGNYYNYYPLGPSILSAPLIWGIERLLDGGFQLREALRQGQTALPDEDARAADLLAGSRFELERFVASFFVALAAMFVFLLCLEELPWRWSATMALAFSFATPAWSIGSRGAWQHTYSMPLLAAALWLLIRARQRPGLVPWVGLVLMTAFWMRTTNLLSLVVFSAFVLVFHRRQLPGYLAAMVPPVLLFGGINFSVFGSLMPPYSNAQTASALLKVHGRFGEALAANLISPGRGLFVFSPIFALAGFAVNTGEENKQLRWLRLSCTVICLIHWLVMSSVVTWWAGHCYGPRFFADITPLLCFLMIPAVQRIRAGSVPLATLAAVLLSWSLFAHSQGVFSTAALNWNNTPVSIDLQPSRVWDWSNAPFFAEFRTAQGAR